MSEALVARPPRRAVSARTFALAAAILVCYTASWIAARAVALEVSPLWSSVGRLFASLAAIALVLLLAPSQRLRRGLLRERAGGFLQLAVLGFAAYFCLTFAALRWLNASQLVVALSLTPGLTYVLALLMRREGAALPKTAGVALATLAVLWFNRAAFEAFDGPLLVGLALAAAAALSYALYGLLYGQHLAGVPLPGALGALLAVALLILLPLALLFEPVPLDMTGRTLATLVLIGAFLSAPTYLMYADLVLSGGALLASLVGILGVFSVLFAEYALGFRAAVTPGELAAAGLCALGVALVVLSKKKEAAA